MKLNVRLSPRRFRRRWQHGRSEGYPTCCIAWFCIVRIPLHPQFYHDIQVWFLYRWPHLKKYNHVQCPLCWVKNIRRIDA